MEFKTVLITINSFWSHGNWEAYDLPIKQYQSALIWLFSKCVKGSPGNFHNIPSNVISVSAICPSTHNRTLGGQLRGLNLWLCGFAFNWPKYTFKTNKKCVVTLPLKLNLSKFKLDLLPFPPETAVSFYEYKIKADTPYRDNRKLLWNVVADEKTNNIARCPKSRSQS